MSLLHILSHFKKHFCRRFKFRYDSPAPSHWSQHLKTCVFKVMCTQAITPQSFLPRHPDPLFLDSCSAHRFGSLVRASQFFYFLNHLSNFHYRGLRGKRGAESIRVNHQGHCCLTGTSHLRHATVSVSTQSGLWRSKKRVQKQTFAVESLHNHWIPPERRRKLL